MNKFGEMLLPLIITGFLPDGLVKIDKALFYKINGQWHNAFFDQVLPLVREPTVWVPFYFFLIVFMAINFRLKGWIWILSLLALAGISDYTSSTIIKSIFFRMRPCGDAGLAETVRFIVSYCPRSSSFVSSHAVNHFAISTFIFVTFKGAISRKWIFIFLWAAMICYAQVYVGVHFPVDVTGGAIVGILLGYGGASLFNRYSPLPASH